MISPYKGKFEVTQIFKSLLHKGLDLVGSTSKLIYSTVDGVVEVAGWDSHPTGGMGLYIRIREDGTERRFYFAHLSKVTVKAGQRVKKGDQIGVEGSTGHSTGSHLHYEIRSRPDNTTFLDVSEISGIPNEMGTYEQEVEELERNIKDTTVKIGDTEVSAKLIDGVTYVPLRGTIEAIKAELDVTWDKVNGAGVAL